MACTRLVDQAKDALAELAAELEVSPAKLMRGIVTAGLRTLYVVDDEVADKVIASLRSYRRQAR